uniref:Integrase, catalytic region, zinc finger, CCHC-type, peptidase aspartic, catalytic n=1 Tax=Tanacetum cinerariifolium TaxID=118510 RepID=A0A699HIT2_TANCI|nr:integrase, catalytic region, zinc finger, CCHC-type, peptidase aspartic, catalytic [Tanacetum cinerariifolium]
MQTHTSNTLHNAIMEAGGKDRPPMLAPGIDNNIYSTVDACPNACEMWKSIERLKQVNDLRAKRIARTANPLAIVAQQQPVYHPHTHPTHYTVNSSTRSQQAAIRNKGKAIINSPPPIYDQEPSMVTEDDELSKDKEIDKLIALISLSQRIGNVAEDRETVGTTVVQKSKIQCFNCKEFGHVARECQKPKREKDAAYHREKMLLCKQEEAGFQLNAEQADWRDDTDDEPEDQELEAHYMYIAQIQEVTPDAADNLDPSLILSHCKREQIDQNDDDDLANERELLASLIEKLKCEIDDNKNRNKFLETSNKVLVDKLKDEIKDFKTKNKSLESSNNHFKKANNKLSKTNELMYNDLKKFQAELDRFQTMNMLNRNCKTSFAKPEFLKKAQRANPRLYDIGCYSDHLALMLAPESDEVILLEKESRSKLSDLTRPFDYEKLNNLYDLFVPQREKSSAQRYFSERKTVASASTNQKPKNTTRKLYENVSKACSWWYPKFTPPGYKWKPKSQIGNVNPNVSMPLGNASRTANILKPMTSRRSKKFLGMVKFRNDQYIPILGYGDLVQGSVTIKRVYYVEGLNHNLFSVGQFCDANLKVAFRKSTCYIRDLKGNDLLIGSRGTDLYSITLQDTSSLNPICLMAKATSSQAWLWHRRLSHLNFDTINLLSKNDIVIGLPK